MIINFFRNRRAYGIGKFNTGYNLGKKETEMLWRNRNRELKLSAEKELKEKSDKIRELKKYVAVVNEKLENYLLFVYDKHFFKVDQIQKETKRIDRLVETRKGLLSELEELEKVLRGSVYKSDSVKKAIDKFNTKAVGE